MSSINFLIASFCSLKLCIKYKFIDHIVNKYPINSKFDKCIKSVKNMQSNGLIFKIYSNVNDI